MEAAGDGGRQAGAQSAATQERGAAPPERWFRELAENSGDVFYVIRTDPDFAIEFISDSINLWGGLTAADYLANSQLFRSLLDPRDADVVAQVMTAEPGVQMEVTCRWVHRDGRPIWTRNWTRRRIRRDGSIVLEGRTQDITAEVEARDALARSQEHYRLLAEQSSDFTLRTVHDFKIEWVSPSVTRVLGWEPEELVGRRGFEFFHPNDVEATQSTARTVSSGESASGLVRLRAADGTYHWFSQVASPVFNDQGKLEAWISGFQNADAEVFAKQALARNERRLRMVMEFAPTGMAVVDLDRQFAEVNPALCRLLDHTEEWLLGRSIEELLSAEDIERDAQLRAEVLDGAESAHIEQRMRTRDGSQIWVEHSLGLLRDDDGTPISYISQFVDVTDVHEAQEQLRYQADHDPLTALANRHQLFTRMSRILKYPPHAGFRVGVLFVDLDEFKPINDTFGHATGDEVLVETARRIRSAVRGDDLVARIGGDEFVIALLAVRGLSDAERVGATLREALAQPISVAGSTVQVTVSVGVAMAQAGEAVNAVLQRADRALYRAKRLGRNRVVSDTPSEGDEDTST